MDNDNDSLRSAADAQNPPQAPAGPAAADSPIKHHGEGGEAGQGGAVAGPPTPPNLVTNAAFAQAVYQAVPDGAVPAVCTKAGDPERGPWPALPLSAAHARCIASNNNYLNCSSFRPEGDQQVRARKQDFAACHFILLDDLGTKISMELLGDLKPSWLLETSPGNMQAGILFKEPITDAATVDALLAAIIDAGLCDPGASGPAARWARLPIGVNGKPKYRVDGKPFVCRLVEWAPERRYTGDEVAQLLKLDLKKPQGKPKAAAQNRRTGGDYNAAYTPSAAENPVIAALKAEGLYKRSLGSGKHDITCPWVQEHTDSQDTGAAYFEPDAAHPVGGFCCQHSHRDTYHVGELLRYLDVDFASARNRPCITVTPGGLHAAVDAAERVLADSGKYYEAGGLIATIGKDPETGDPKIVPANASTLTLELSRLAEWTVETQNGPRPTDPPPKHIKALHELQTFKYLPALTGFARQPYFREDGGQLITEAGHDPASGRFGVFAAERYRLPEPTLAAAKEALALMKGLLSEFHFASEQDRAVALAAMLTAAVRPTLPLAPAFHVQASTPGSGKTYLCELIGLFAGPAPNQKVTYPASAEEASKMMLAVLMPGPAVVEFDDMDSDWKPFSAIKRVLTASVSSDRILGLSKTATVSTRTLFLASGNNVGPVRDLLRRVLTIRLEPQVQSPATLQYQGSPVDRLRRNRERYVAAALTIIRAWQAADSPRAGSRIASYGAAWADYCQHPLVWLGVADPVATIIAQLANDSDSEALGRLMTVWAKTFGEKPVTVRKLKSAATLNEDLFDAVSEFPVTQSDGINPSKMGWFLKKNSGRIVDGRKFQRVDAADRTAWALVPAGQVAALPPSPPSATPLQAAGAEDELDLELVAFSF
ncbi:DNA-primase RepB domain-containing protein [Ramlibacter sp.]|uniref:DNA-primase RepB domain-containing protein n=1 Tax=Ramlibacter sp. TaxID=1917967 RepID=UPI002BF74AD8|nr:DNA-primase RepB domain-containing protein [Ramlibacter sp.]HWI82694.1 DNA-primase RepB domain-containing protein [Ramlibacter sp.]